MQFVIRKIIIVMSVVLAFSWANITYANSFGQTCSALPISDDSGYLNDDTAYGYIKRSLDMQSYVADGCDQTGSFQFCIKNQNGSDAACQQASISVGSSALLKSLSSNPDLGGSSILGEISLSVREMDDSTCLFMPTSRGSVPLLCRGGTNENKGVTDETLEAVCRNIDESCYSGNVKSQSLFSFSGVAVHCLKKTLDKVLYLGNECPVTEEESALGSLRPFAGFQESMKMAVRAALIIYVMVYGFKLVMNNEFAHFDKIALFLIKFLFVAYFAVGLGSKTLENGKAVSHNGMTELALPIFTELTVNFAEMIFLAGGSQGLCAFDHDKYEAGYRFYRVWDAIDCRVGYYLGLQLLYNIGGTLDSLSSAGNEVGRPINFDSNVDDAYKVVKKTGALLFFVVMTALFLGGNILIVILGIVFAVIFLSVILHFITVYLISLITLYVMAYISPIFVPMILFERTKGYFDSWLKVVVSCILQPAIIAGFIALLLTVYDSAIYGNCEFQRHDYDSNGHTFSTFELRLPDAEEEKCTSSFGYKLLGYYSGEGWQSKNLTLFNLISVRGGGGLLNSLLYVMIYVIIFYYFIQSANEFASDLTGGPNLGGVTASPTAIMDAALSAAISRSGAKSIQRNAKSGGKDLSADRAATGGGMSSGDSVSTGGGGSKDSFSTGAGSGSSGGGDGK